MEKEIFGNAGGDPNDNGNGEGEGGTDPLEQLQNEIKAMKAENKDFRKQITGQNKTILDLMSKPPEQQAHAMKIVIPDPAEDPDGYKKAIDDQAQARIDASEKRIEDKLNSRLDVKDKNSTLLGMFSKKFPKLAENDMDLVEFVGGKLLKGKSKEEADDYMYGDMSKFVIDVGEEVHKMKGLNMDDEDDGRSKALPFGSPGGSKKPSRKKDSQVMSFVDSHKKLRSETWPLSTPSSMEAAAKNKVLTNKLL